MDRLLEQCRVRPAPDPRHRAGDRLPCLRHQVLRQLRLDEPARDQVRTRAQPAGVAVDADRRDQHAVAGQVAPVAQHDLLDVADAQPVHEHEARDVVLPGGHRVRRQVHHTAVFQHQDAILGDALRERQVGVVPELAVLPVHRDEEVRTHQPQHLAQLAPVGVAGHVDMLVLGIEDAPRPVPIQVVDRVVDEALVAGDGSGRDHHPVAVADVHDRVAARGEA